MIFRTILARVGGPAVLGGAAVGLAQTLLVGVAVSCLTEIGCRAGAAAWGAAERALRARRAKKSPELADQLEDL